MSEIALQLTISETMGKGIDLFALFFRDHWFELLAAILSLWCVILAAKNSIYNWPIAMMGSIMYVFVFFGGGLYSDAFLNVVFLGFQSFGWYKWRKQRGDSSTDSKPSWANIRSFWRVLLVGGVCYYPWVMFVQAGSFQFLLGSQIPSVPKYVYVDAALLMLSLSALYMQAKRWIQNWWVWILVDVVYIPLYIANDNWITAILYFIYIPLAWKGYKMWRVEQ